MSKIGTLSQDQIKEINRVNIINIIKKNGEITKQEIANQLGLSIPTVTTNINMLIEDGLVEEAGVAESTGGRKPVILRFIEGARYSVGVNISPDHIDILLINLNAKHIDETSFLYRREYTFYDVLELLEDEIDKLLKKNRISKKRVTGIGISLPGLVDEDKLILENAPNIGVKDFDFSEFANRMGMHVYIENEANIAAFAETELGKAKNRSNVVYVSITDGVGTGIIVDHHIYKSSNKKAGEFGHMRITNEDLKCNCGRTGCWELYASKKALFKYYKESTGIRVSSLENVFLAKNYQDANVQSALEKYTESLFVGIENIILGLNPEFVIIGGELGKYEQEMLTLVDRTMNLKSAYMEYEGTKILFSELQDKGSLVGAALLPFQEIFNYKKGVI